VVFTALQITKKDIACLSVAISVTLLVRVFLMLSASSLYGQDAYNYLNAASNFASSGSITIGAGAPFILFLGLFIKVSSPLLGAIVASRIFMLLASSVLICITYLIGSKVAGKLFGLIAALIITFQPIFLMYSIVPHNDVFAITLALLAFYLISSSNKFAKNFFAPICFYIAVFTRPELYFALVLPILILYLWTKRNANNGRSRFKTFSSLAFASIIYILPFLIIYFFISYDRFTVIERVVLFLRPDLFNVTLTSAFNFSSNQLLNQCLFLFAVIGVLLSVFSLFINIDLARIRKEGFWMILRLNRSNPLKRIFGSINSTMVFCLLLAFIFEVVGLTLLSYNYTWAFVVDNQSLSNLDLLKQAVIITPHLHDRYVVLPMLLIGYALAYPLCIAIRKVIKLNV